MCVGAMLCAGGLWWSDGTIHAAAPESPAAQPADSIEHVLGWIRVRGQEEGKAWTDADAAAFQRMLQSLAKCMDVDGDLDAIVPLVTLAAKHGTGFEVSMIAGPAQSPTDVRWVLRADRPKEQFTIGVTGPRVAVLSEGSLRVFTGPGASGMIEQKPFVDLPTLEEKDDGSVWIDAKLDLNAVRRRAPALLIDGMLPTVPGVDGEASLARAADLLGFGNARYVHLIVRRAEADKVPTRDPSLPLPPSARGAAQTPYAGPPLLMAELRYESRAEKPGTVRTLALTSDYWPLSTLGATMASGQTDGVIAVLKPDIMRILSRAVALYSLSLPREKIGGGPSPGETGERLILRASNWLREHQRPLGRIESGVGGASVLRLGVGGPSASWTMTIPEVDPVEMEQALDACFKEMPRLDAAGRRVAVGAGGEASTTWTIARGAGRGKSAVVVSLAPTEQLADAARETAAMIATTK
jgi:hypothetical protein